MVQGARDGLCAVYTGHGRVVWSRRCVGVPLARQSSHTRQRRAPPRPRRRPAQDGPARGRTPSAADDSQADDQQEGGPAVDEGVRAQRSSLYHLAVMEAPGLHDKKGAHVR